MWRIVGLPWPSSRMIVSSIDSNLLKSQKLKNELNKAIKVKLKVNKKNKYDPELGVEFPSSRFN